MIIKEIANAIKKSGQSYSQIAEKTGVDRAVLSRIVNDGSCNIETADILLKYFGLTVTKKTKKKAR